MENLIEQEVEARVKFKMNEILTAVENTAKANWSEAFHNNSQRHAHYFEAFEQMKKMLIKEMNLPVPYDDMAQQKRRKKRDEAINKIMERFCIRGENNYHAKERFLVSIIENIQND